MNKMTNVELLNKYVKACIEIDREEKNYITYRPTKVILKDLENLEKEILRRLNNSSWHTEPPTEEDLKDIDEDNKYCFALCLYYDGWWLSDYLFKVNMEEKCFETATRDKDEIPHRISFATSVVWKKIEPYEA